MNARRLLDRRKERIISEIVASIMAIGMAGRAAKAQTTNISVAPLPLLQNLPVSPPIFTNAVAPAAQSGGPTNIPVAPAPLLVSPPVAPATSTNAAAPAALSGSSTNVTELPATLVTAHRLNTAREQILPDLGTMAHTFDETQLQAIPEGENAPFNEIILRAPGVAQDSAVNGDLHVRGEHANLQYRINNVLLPEGISGFGLELDPRFVQSMDLITGALPAAYGFRTAGVVDIKTKSGFENAGDVSIYGGSFNTIRPSFEYGGTQGKWNFFATGSYEQNDLGIENPTPSYNAIHDHTDQYKTFLYGSYIIDDTSRLTLMGSASYSDFQVPNTPDLSSSTNTFSTNIPQPTWASYSATTGLPANFNSADLNENQNEQNYFAVGAYQKSAGPFNAQVSVFGRISSVHFMPDPVGDLFFNGVASDVDRKLYSGGLQLDASYELNDKHTFRGGVMLINEGVSAHSTATVFPLDANGNPTGTTNIINDGFLHGLFAGIYAQDEWKLFPKVTVNYGARFDIFYASFDKENQPSPRVNLIYTPTDSTTLHAGYSRYFTPPPVASVPSINLAEFDNTSNEASTNRNSGVKAERANYFDVGASQKIGSHFQIGLDGYYKNSVNQLDDGLFGQSLIPSAFNYAEGRIYGVEFPISYSLNAFSAYANIAYSVAQGKEWSSSQFLFGPEGAGTAFNFVQSHWVYLDHDQRVTGSFGAAYTWKHSWGDSGFFVDALYGSGLRQDGGEIPGTTTPIPNGGTVPAYYSVSLGAEESYKLSGKQVLKARLDVVNVTDNIYQLRSGTGIGVNAAQYGQRLGFFGTLSYLF